MSVYGRNMPPTGAAAAEEAKRGAAAGVARSVASTPPPPADPAPPASNPTPSPPGDLLAQIDALGNLQGTSEGILNDVEAIITLNGRLMENLKQIEARIATEGEKGTGHLNNLAAAKERVIAALATQKGMLDSIAEKVKSAKDGVGAAQAEALNIAGTPPPRGGRRRRTRRARRRNKTKRGGFVVRARHSRAHRRYTRARRASRRRGTVRRG